MAWSDYLKGAIGATVNIVKKTPGVVRDVLGTPGNDMAKFGRTIGDAAANTGFGKAVGGFLANAITGGDAAKKRALHDQLVGVNNQISTPTVFTPSGEDLSTVKSGKEAIGRLAQDAAILGAPAALGSLGMSPIGISATSGALFGGGEAAKKNLPNEQIAISAGEGAITGAIAHMVISTALGVMGNIKKNVSDTFSPSNIYNRQLQPSTKEVAFQLKHGYNTIGDDVVENNLKAAQDQLWRTQYRGTPEEMMQQAKEAIPGYDKILRENLSEIPGYATRTNLRENVYKFIENTYGKAALKDPSIIKVVEGEMSGIPTKFGGIKALDLRRTTDYLINDSTWTSERASLVQDTRYAIRTFFKKFIDQISAGTPVVQQANNALHTALEVSDLASFQSALAKKGLQPKGTFSGKLGTKAIDTLFNVVGGEGAPTNFANKLLSIKASPVVGTAINAAGNMIDAIPKDVPQGLRNLLIGAWIMSMAKGNVASKVQNIPAENLGFTPLPQEQEIPVLDSTEKPLENPSAPPSKDGFQLATTQ